MEKNVPLLKLIQDHWSIKTMLWSRFHVRPSASSLFPSTTTQPASFKGVRRNPEEVGGVFFGLGVLLLRFSHSGRKVLVLCGNGARSEHQDESGGSLK